MQWLQDSNHSSVNNLDNVRHEASGHLRNKKKECLKAKIDELEINSKIKKTVTCEGSSNDFKKVYQPRTNIPRGEKDDLFTDSHSILARWRNHFS